MDTLTFRKVRSLDRIDHDAIKVMLFEDEAGRFCGWFIGPVRITEAKVAIPYLPRSERTLASVAIIRAVEAAKTAGLELCVVDPDDLWEPAWRVQSQA